MSQILKTFLGLFLILTMVATSAGILSSFLSVMTAQNMPAAMISEMEDSDFYPQVIMDCFNTAQEKGYELSVTVYGMDNSVVTCTRKEDVPTNIEVQMARVELKFDYLLSFFGRDNEHLLDGYAR